MKSVVEDISPVKKKIRIEIPPTEVVKEKDKALADLSRKAKIPGFRPGKAPKAVVERHFGDDVKADVMHKLITNAYLRAVQEHRISPVETPEISDVSPFSSESPLSFSAVVEVRPPIKLADYSGIEVTDRDAKASDEEVDQTINRLREMYASMEVVEGRKAEQGDTLVVDFTGFREGKPIENAKATDYLLTIGSGNLIPGFEEQVVGMGKGETKDISVTFPPDYSNKELAGAQAKFTVTVKEIKRAVLPELNDEFAKDVGEHKNIEELRTRVREDIEARKRNELASAQREELLSKLVDSHGFEVPQAMIDGELQSLTRQQAFRLYRQGVDPKAFDEAKFREQNRPLAEKRAKGLLILDAIAEKEGITVDDAELQAQLGALARSAGKTVAEIRKYYDSTEGGLETLRTSLVHDKTLALLLSRASKRYN